jgi:protease-4
VRKAISKLLGYLGLAALAILALLGLGWLLALPFRHSGSVAIVAAITFGAVFVLQLLLKPLAKRAGKGRTVLEWELTTLPPEVAPNDPLSTLRGKKGSTLASVTQTLRDAADDPAVAGLFVAIDLGPTRPAGVQELADAIRDFRASGKIAVAYAETFAGNWGYYLASAFDQVVMLPSGSVDVRGFGVESNFYAKALGKAGIQMLVSRRYDFKDAMDQLGEGAMRAPAKRARKALYESLHGQLVAGIAAGRKLDEALVRDLIDKAPLLDTEALEAGLVDRIGHRDEAIALAKSKAASKAKLRKLDDYGKQFKRKSKSSPIALITASGTMIRRGSNPIAGRSPMRGDELSGVLRKALTDKKVKAVVLRVDTPGGEAIAGEMIGREISRLRAAGKPVVVSMGAVAASGGYWISAPADRIIAQPTTITGSIGVVSAQPVTGRLKRRLGIKTDEISTAAHANMRTVNRPPTESEQERIDASMDDIYDRFVDLVAAGRKMSKETVHEHARGRAWSGVDAKEIGLVDELGGLPVALRVAKELAGLTDKKHKKLRLRPYPATSALDALRHNKPDSQDEAAAALGGLLAASLPYGAGEVAAQAGLDLRHGEVNSGLHGFLR